MFSKQKSFFLFLLVIISFFILIGAFLCFHFFSYKAPALCKTRLTRTILDRSLRAGTSYLLHNQKKEGNFYYQYDFLKKKYSKGDSEVRQAGALWGLALN